MRVHGWMIGIAKHHQCTINEGKQSQHNEERVPVPTAKPRLQVVFESVIYEQLQKLQQATGKSLSTLASDLVNEALEARAAGSSDASVLDQLRHVVNQLEAKS